MATRVGGRLSGTACRHRWQLASDLPAREEGGVTWLQHDAAVIAGHQKLFADTREGWIAHLDDDVLFVKTFTVVAREQHAPGEAQVEIYAASAHRYLEIEVQGPCETIPPGGAATWVVDWRLRRVPHRIERGLGSAGLGLSGTGSGSNSSPSNFQKYNNCIHRAGGNVAKLQKCAPLLNGGG